MTTDHAVPASPSKATSMPIEFANPDTGNRLVLRDDAYYDAVSGARVGVVVDGVPRFVPDHDQYAASFGWQWNRWEHTLSDSRSATNANAKRELLLSRTRFAEFDLRGKTILECGMGGGDDTEVLLQFPFAEVHSFDLSRAVDRARRFLRDERLVLSQADIFRMPYRDESFDFVFCHRVVQHTPDPVRAIRSIARKVKPGGVLFVHSYHLSWWYAMNYKYKYRWITRRLPVDAVAGFLERHGAKLHAVNEACRRRNYLLRMLAYNFVPFEMFGSYGARTGEELVELGKLITFDALTPRYDKPMTWRTMRRTLESEGLEIYSHHDHYASPLWCTAVKRK